MQRISHKNVRAQAIRIFESPDGPRIWIEFSTERGDKLELEMHPREIRAIGYLVRKARIRLKNPREQKVTEVRLQRQIAADQSPVASAQSVKQCRDKLLKEIIEGQQKPKTIPLKPRRRLNKPLI